MRRVARLRVPLVVVAGVAMLAQPAGGQELALADPLDGVLSAAPGTPDGQGLLPVALGDA